MEDNTALLRFSGENYGYCYNLYLRNEAVNILSIPQVIWLKNILKLLTEFPFQITTVV